MPLSCLRALTWSSLGLEYAAAPLILLPFLQPWLRRIAILGLVTFHLGTWATMHLGNFPWAMMSTYALLLLPADWEFFGRRLARWSRPITVYYDHRDVFAQGVVRLLRDLDWFHKIRFAASDSDQEMESRLRRAIGLSGLVAHDQDTSEVLVGTNGMLRIFEALPLPWHICGIAGLPGLAWLTDKLCRFVARRRVGIARGLGWRLEPAIPVEILQAASPSQLHRIRRMLVVGAETVAVGFLLVCVLYQSYNRDLAPSWDMRRVKEPSFVRVFVMAAHLNHGWGMLAPDPPTPNAGGWVIEGETRSGKKIDPFTGREPTWEKPTYLANQLNLEWRRYLLAISNDKRRAYRTYFAKYLTRRFDRETQGDDRLARFRLFYVRERTKPPGSAEPFPTKQTVLFSHECLPAAKTAQAESTDADA